MFGVDVRKRRRVHSASRDQMGSCCETPSALLRNPTELPNPSPGQDTTEVEELQLRKETSLEPGHAGTLGSDIQPTELGGMNFRIHKPPSLWKFVTAA